MTAAEPDELQQSQRVRLGPLLLGAAETEQDQRELNQRSAPAVEDGLFLVPKVIE